MMTPCITIMREASALGVKVHLFPLSTIIMSPYNITDINALSVLEYGSILKIKN